jgi:uncharacterized pyridoxamine 5'-phosphate oxidase family protein
MDLRPTNPIMVIPTNPTANCVDVPITLYNNVVSATITTTTAGVTITPSTVTSSQIISVCVPVNNNPKCYIMDESNNALFPPILHNFNSTTMIQEIIDMLKITDHLGVSENIEIAKGKYKLTDNLKEIYKQEKRKLYFKNKK